MEEKLPDKFDVVILGTGLSESILSAALSRHGCTVLHLDRNCFYGGGEAVLSLQGLLNLESSQPSTPEDCANYVLKFSQTSSAISNVSKTAYTISDEERDKFLSIEALINNTLLNARNEAQCLREQLVASKPTASSTELTARPQDSTDQLTSDETKPEILEPTVISNIEQSNDTSTVDFAADNEASENNSPTVTSADGSATTPAASQTNGESQGLSDEMKNAITSKLEKLENEIASLRDEIQEEEKKINPTVYRYMQIISKNDESLKREGTADDKFKYLLEKNSAFCLDLSPKLLFSKSEMVDLLISSDVARYLEFKSVSKILTSKNNQLQVVPCSRADIFSTKFLTMIEKRLLMKLLTICMEKEKHQQLFDEYADKPIIEFLKSQKLTENLLHYILSSIAMCTPSCPTEQALDKLTRFVQSVGRYGSTPFLWSLYGGEISQAFCRMSAVFGGVYVLNRSISEAKINPQTNKMESIVTTDGQQVTCNWLLWNIADYSILKEQESSRISRAIIITDQSVYESEKEEVFFMSLPHEDPESEPITVLELGPGSCACPHNRGELRVLHLTCKSVRKTAEEDLKPALLKLIPQTADNGKKTPRILLSVYWNQCDYKSHMKLDNDNNTVQFHGPDSNIDPDTAVTQARLAFEKICPGAEFLPRPPNPEDIIYCDDTEKSSSEQENFQLAADQSGDNVLNEPDTAKATGQSGDGVTNEPGNGESTYQSETVDAQETARKETEEMPSVSEA